MLILKKPTLIAEIGINHNGSVKIAKKLIDLAKDNGFHYVKFQKRSPEISTPEIQKNVLRDTPWGSMSYLKYKKKIELSIKQYDEINKYCKKKKIKWFVSCWDIKSLKDMKKYNFDYHKIASAMITNYPFLIEVAKTRTPTIISTGMCTEKDIAKAVNIFRKYNCKFSLLHCVSTYPANEKDLNLNLIQVLKKKFKCPVGYSGHESSVSPTITAYIMGATIIERHITLDRSMWGTDQAASLSSAGIKSLISVLNKLPKFLGTGKKNFLTEEKKIAKKLRYW